MKYYNILKLAAWSDVDPTSQVFHSISRDNKLTNNTLKQKAIEDCYNYNPVEIPSLDAGCGIKHGLKLQKELDDQISRLNGNTNIKDTGARLRHKVEEYMQCPAFSYMGADSNNNNGLVNNTPITSMDEINKLKKQLAESHLGLFNSKEFQNHIKIDRLGRAMSWIMSDPYKNTNPKLHNLMNSMRFSESGAFSYDPTGNLIFMKNDIDPYALTHEIGHVDAMHTARTDPKYYTDINHAPIMDDFEAVLTKSKKYQRRAMLGMLRMEAEANSHSNNLLRQSLKNNPKLLNQLMFGRSLSLPAAYSTYLSSCIPFSTGLIPKMPEGLAVIPWAGLTAAHVIPAAAMGITANSLVNAGTFAARHIHPNLPNDIIAHAQNTGMPEYWSDAGKIEELRKSIQAPLRKEEISTKAPVTVQKTTNKVSPMARRLLKGGLNKR